MKYVVIGSVPGDGCFVEAINAREALIEAMISLGYLPSNCDKFKEVADLAEIEKKTNSGFQYGDYEVREVSD